MACHQKNSGRRVKVEHVIFVWRNSDVDFTMLTSDGTTLNHTWVPLYSTYKSCFVIPESAGINLATNTILTSQYIIRWRTEFIFAKALSFATDFSQRLSHANNLMLTWIPCVRVISAYVAAPMWYNVDISTPAYVTCTFIIEPQIN